MSTATVNCTHSKAGKVSDKGSKVTRDTGLGTLETLRQDLARCCAPLTSVVVRMNRELDATVHLQTRRCKNSLQGGENPAKTNFAERARRARLTLRMPSCAQGAHRRAVHS